MRRVLLSVAVGLIASLVITTAQQAPPAPPAGSPQRGTPVPTAAQGVRPTPLIAFEPVRPIEPPAHPIPPEPESARVTQFSFIVYGDTRSGAIGDGEVVHPIHTQVMNGILAVVKARQRTRYPVRFVLQTGDAVLRGATGRMWNVSYTPIIERLTKGADVPYFLTAGNHDVAPTTPGDPVRQLGLHNTLSAMAKLVPAEGSPRRLNGYATYSFGYGNVFVIAIDSTLAGDPLQFAWVSSQLAQLDRARFVHVVAFVHYAPYSSGPHGVAVEPQTLAMRNTYMPLFRKHHVRIVAAGHEHFFEQWIERYVDGVKEYRIDTLVTGGGGAPTYTYRAEPDLAAYVAAGAAQHVRVEHLVKPGTTSPDNPNHFLVIQVDGDRLSEEVVAPANPSYAPFKGGAARIDLGDDGS